MTNCKVLECNVFERCAKKKKKKKVIECMKRYQRMPNSSILEPQQLSSLTPSQSSQAPPSHSPLASIPKVPELAGFS